jgi:hypothetical protein
LNKNFKGYGIDLFAQLKSQDGLKIKNRIGSISFPTGLEAVQLQAADLLCCRSYDYAQRRLTDPNAKLGGVLESLIRRMKSREDFPFFQR